MAGTGAWPVDWMATGTTPEDSTSPTMSCITGGARSTDGGAHQVNFVSNYYKPGAGTTKFAALTADNENAGLGTQQYYFAGNVMPGRFDESNQEDGRRTTGSVSFENFVDTAFFPSFVTTQRAGHAYKVVLSDVGCRQPVLDDHDQRMIQEALDSTYTVIGSVTGKKGFPDDEADAGGYEDYPAETRPADWDSDSDGLPDWYETIIGTNLNSGAGDFSDANADPDLDGYTNLDDYLQWMDKPHFGTATGDPLTINLQKLSRGFVDAPSYSVSNVVNGTHTLRGCLDFSFTAPNLSFSPLSASVFLKILPMLPLCGIHDRDLGLAYFLKNFLVRVKKSCV